MSQKIDVGLEEMRPFCHDVYWIEIVLYCLLDIWKIDYLSIELFEKTTYTCTWYQR